FAQGQERIKLDGLLHSGLPDAILKSMRAFQPIRCLASVLAIAACGASPASRTSEQQTASSTVPGKPGPSAHDWTRFGWDVGRSSATADETGITAANVGTMRRQQVTLDGTVDASPI